MSEDWGVVHSFGMVMPGRTYTYGSGYRYGFNGKENDNEVKGEGNSLDYGMRIYDPRLGRFLSVDPLAKNYPELTPYQFASNRPIDGIDQDGLEWQKSDPYFISPIGKYGYTYNITVSLADSKNQLKLSNTNDKQVLLEVKNRAKEILESSYKQAKGTKEDPFVSYNIVYSEDKGPFSVSFKDFYTYLNSDPQTGRPLPSTGDPSAYGVTKTNGQTQANDIQIAISNHLKLSQKGMPSIKVSDEQNTVEVMARSLAHELGHTAGLFHPFSTQNDIPEISNDLGLPPNKPDLIKNNLMNSEGNPVKSLQSNTGTEMIQQQRDKIKTTVESQQPTKKPPTSNN